MERLAVDARPLRGLRDIPAVASEEVGQVLLRERLEPGLAGLGEWQVPARKRRSRTTSSADVIGRSRARIIGPSVRAGALDHVLELADVAGPGVALEARERVCSMPARSGSRFRP